jgi:CRISPR-associated protein Csh1
MINAIMNIGKWAAGVEGSAGSLINFVQNPNEKGRIHKVVAILLERRGDNYLFKDVDLEDFRGKYVLKYLYRFGSPSGSDMTPTSKFAGNLQKTFRNKIVRCIDNIKKEGRELGLDETEQEEIRQIVAAIAVAQQTIEARLNERSKELEKDEGAIITLVFLQNGVKRYIGDMTLFRKVLMHRAKAKYYEKYNKKALGYNQTCLVCQERQPEVYGFVNTYNFYTVDKPGFVTGGFKQQDAWKNYPVCLQCAGYLELGRKYLNENLNFGFYGFRYLLVPKFFSEKIMKEVLETLEDAFPKRAGEVVKASFQDRYINRLTDAEDEILDLVGNQKDNVCFDLLFYREKQAAFNILLHIEDVLPSRFKFLFDTKDRLDAVDIFKREVSPKDGQRLIVFNFKILRIFFPYVSKTVSSNKHFLELVGKIFSLKPIDYYFLVRCIMTRLRLMFIRDEYLKIDCLSGYMLLNYLASLGILSKGGYAMEAQPIEDLKAPFWDENTNIAEKIDLFFQSHQGFFDHAEKRACFLVGMLTQKLLNIQWNEKKATPFRSKLHGLRLNEALVKRVSYEAQNKLEEYDKNYYRELESVIAQYMVAAGSEWKCTNDEISFYFTVGMNTENLFKSKKEGLDDEQSDE